MRALLYRVIDDQGRRIDFNLYSNGLPRYVQSNETYTSGQSHSLVSYQESDYAVDSLNYPPVAPNGASDLWTHQLTTAFYVQGQAAIVLANNLYIYDLSGQRLSNQVTGGTGATRTDVYAYDSLPRRVAVNYGDGD